MYEQNNGVRPTEDFNPGWTERWDMGKVVRGETVQEDPADLFNKAVIDSSCQKIELVLPSILFFLLVGNHQTLAHPHSQE